MRQEPNGDKRKAQDVILLFSTTSVTKLIHNIVMPFLFYLPDGEVGFECQVGRFTEALIKLNAGVVVGVRAVAAAVVVLIVPFGEIR